MCGAAGTLSSAATALRPPALHSYRGRMAALTRQLIPVSRAQTWAESGRLWAVLDATDTPEVLDLVDTLGEDAAVSLYRGLAEERLAAIAPYLVHVDWSTSEWITRRLWSAPWGIFAVADTDLETLRTHLRRFLIVEAPDGAHWYFRYYDPRVLLRYLPICTAHELADFFGPIEVFAVTDAASYRVIQLGQKTARHPAQVRRRVVIKR